MSEWKKARLSDCCQSIADGDHQPPPKAEKGIPFVTIANITSSNQFDFSNTLHVPREYYESLDYKRKPQKNDVLYSVVGSFGIPVFMKYEKEFVFQRHIAILRPNSEILFPKFLYYSMLTKDFYAQADAAAIGAAQRTVSLSALRNMIIAIPPMKEQIKMAEVLSSYDELIETNQRQIKLLEEASQRLYKEWFVDLRYPGHENVPVVDGVPEGWRKGFLADIADVIMGQSPKSEFYNHNHEGLPFHQGVGSYGYRFVCDETYSTSFTRIAPANSVLFSVRAPVGRLNINKNKVVIGRGLAAMNHKEGFQSYLFYMLKERFFMEDMVGNGSIFASISKEELLGQLFVLPSITLVKKFNNIASSIDEQIQSVDSQIQLLTEARDRLLPKLMSGEIPSDDSP